MISASFLPLCFLAVASSALCAPTDLLWGPCNTTEISGPLPVECSALDVPLDYTQPNSTRKLTLELLRVPSLTKPSRGSILVNFGGPGLTARSSLASLGLTLQALTGGYYDVLAFDPRGTGKTLPFSCVSSELEAVSLFSDLTLGNSSDTALGRLWAKGEIFSNTCLQKANETGSLIGTAFVARDLISVVDALGEDGLLRYWGFSYGTTLGATVAAMFPERIDRIILDGVQNPHQYYHAAADFEEWTMSDDSFSGIFTSCIEDPQNCVLAQGNTTAAQLEQAAWDLIERIKQRPIALGTILLDYTAIKNIIQADLYNTGTWPELASMMALLLTNNLEVLTALLASSPPVSSSDSAIDEAMAIFGIHCGDRTLRESSYDRFLPQMKKLIGTSRILGDITPAISMTCAQWKMHAKEIYQGDFHVKTKKPVLILGNKHDAFTPLASAYNLSSTFEGSVVTEIDGYGHTSLALPSACTIGVTSNYWLNGTLPAQGKVCKVDKTPYSNVTWTDVIVKVLGNNTSLPKLGSTESAPVVGRRWLI
ncbi:hypothetical protein HYFRA_00004408 [Hymenoscyphus fraxineus]|uniref:Peptidase S33 tripeptidyl aminopeptidase-like C-terminal domain-containing protein n=1 Tax=Hymenoscyphus fraxineus TaxID=746836 RepID=A0A9N9KYM1_9HELO|nr:hypothetical protein HYFRA_00004408 [Hymenoscyphus fraxineus]